jgi:hypothetical protein
MTCYRATFTLPILLSPYVLTFSLEAPCVLNIFSYPVVPAFGQSLSNKQMFAPSKLKSYSCDELGAWNLDNQFIIHVTNPFTFCVSSTVNDWFTIDTPHDIFRYEANQHVKGYRQFCRHSSLVLCRSSFKLPLKNV